MPWEQAAVALSYVLVGIIGVIAKVLWDAVRELEKNLASLRESLAKDYMPRIETRDLFEAILVRIDRLGDEIKHHEQREYEWHRQTIKELKSHYEEEK